MKIGDLVLWKGVNGEPRSWAGVGVVIDYRYFPTQFDEALVLWSDGHSAWYFGRRLTIIKEVL